MNNTLLGFLLFFGLIAIVSALMVIISNNPIHSVLFLVLVFVCVSGMFFLLHVEFIGIIFLMIYVGAISVLFLFVVMMLNIKITEMNETILRYLPIGLVVGMIFLVEILLLLDLDLGFLTGLDVGFLQNYGLISVDSYLDWFKLLNATTNIEAIGLLLYNYYFIYYLLGSIILLLAMVGTIVLTLNLPSTLKKQTIANQLYSANKVVLVNFIPNKKH